MHGCRSPPSTPRSRPRTQSEVDAFSGQQHPHDPMEAVALSSAHEASSNGVGAGDNLVYTNAGTGAIAPATAMVMTTVPGAAEPVTRQKGRFTLRDIGESSQGYSASASTSSSSSPASGGMRPAGQAQTASVLSHGTSATADPSTIHGGGGGGAATAPVPVASSVGGLTELHATMLLLVEQNRQLLERVMGMGNNPHEAYPGTPTFVAPPGHASVGATSGGERQGNHSADRQRTVSLSTLTVQATLPPKPPGSTSSSSERKESPLPRDGTPPGWWGSQGQQGQSGQSGPPPRRPTTVGLGRSDMGIGGGGGSTQGGAGGGSSGGSNKGKDDGTGRRAERGRLSALLDQLRDEIDINTAAKRDTDLELKRVRHRWGVVLRSFVLQHLHMIS